MRDAENLIAAFNLAGDSLALADGTTADRLRKRLEEAAEDAGYSIVLPAAKTAGECLSKALALVEADPSQAQLREKLLLAREQVSRNPEVYQSLTLAILGSGTLIVLALIGKLSYKNGKWEMQEGLPGMEHVAKIFPEFFRSQT